MIGKRVSWRYDSATAILAAGLIAAPVACYAQEQTVRFDIPAQTLDGALKAFARSAHVQVAFDSRAVRGKRAVALTGDYTAQGALTRLLQGTGLVAETKRSGLIIIKPGAPLAMAIAASGPVRPVAGPRARMISPTESVTAGAVASDEIVVTARKREESAIAVPVIVTAITGQQLTDRAVNNIDSVARLVPQMITGEVGGIIGGNVVIRGISGADSNPFGEQAVTFNIDGVQVARAAVRRMAEMDLAQVEVLKGPQTLFFGKNSPGGIISMRTADPTPSFEAGISAGYEFRAHEWRGEGHISGPLSDTLGFRIAGYGSHMRGWVTNTVPESSPYAPHDRHLPHGEDYAVRGTLKFDPSPSFSARFKLGYSKTDNSGIQSNSQYIDCPYGSPQFGDIDECRGNDRLVRGDLGPRFGNLNPVFGNGVPYFEQEQWISSLEMNYDLSDEIRLVSVTGLYDLHSAIVENYTNTANGPFIMASSGRYNVKELSQEVRMQTSFETNLNFLLGGYFQNTKINNATVVALNADQPTLLNDYFLQMKGDAYSAFGQVSYKPVEALEITAGGRYSYEKKRLTDVRRLGVDLPKTFPRKDHWEDFSPEVTVAYRPSTALTVFGSYKEGFLSGGFNAGASNFAGDLRYEQQRIRGFEGGIKAAVFDRALRFNLAAYSYKITGLQVSTLIVENGVPIQSISNAGKVRVKGAEFDFVYQTPVEGLQLRGAVGYNRARYLLYNAPCWRGQSQAQGCNIGIDAMGLGTLQDLAGETLPRAPKWAGNIGADFDREIGSDLKLGLSVNGTFSGSYVGDTKNQPFDVQKAYQLLDASIRVGSSSGSWELALIGRNLTNEYYHSRAAELPLSGSPGGTVAPGRLADTVAILGRGREVMLRAKFKFGS